MANVPTDLFNVVMTYKGPTVDSFAPLPITQIPYVTIVSYMEKVPPTYNDSAQTWHNYMFVWDTKTFNDKNKINGTHSE